MVARPKAANPSAIAESLRRMGQREADKVAQAEAERIAAEKKEAARVLEEKKRQEEIVRLEQAQRTMGTQLSAVRREVAAKDQELRTKDSQLQVKEQELAQLRRQNQEAFRKNADMQRQYEALMEEKRQLEARGQTMKWKCNYCGNLHDEPSDCAMPHLGGKWVPA